jgi:DedD protein
LEMPLQQRLLGAILLIALGVIFIPVLLDGAGYKSRQQRDIEIPPRPEFPPMEEVALKPVVPVHIEPEQAKPEPPPATVAPPPEYEPVPPPTAFTLQVATFSKEASAIALRDKLRKKGHTAYVDSTHGNNRISYRVRIGPELEMARLEKLKARILKEDKLDGFIANYP